LHNLRGFRTLSKFKRASLCIIASMLDEEQIQNATDLFCELDLDSDGLLSHSELRARLESDKFMADLPQVVHDEAMRYQAEETEEPPPYSYSEFLAATFDREACCSKNICKAAFEAFDLDSNGEISISELLAGWAVGDLTQAEDERLAWGLDADENGTINFPEFMAMMQDGEGWTPLDDFVMSTSLGGIR